MLEQAETLIAKSIRMMGLTDEELVRQRYKTVWHDTAIALTQAMRKIEHLQLENEELAKDVARAAQRAWDLAESLQEAVAYADTIAKSEGMPEDKQCRVLTASCVPIEDVDKDMPVARFDVARARRLLT